MNENPKALEKILSTMKNNRYRNLVKTIYEEKSKNIVEIGTNYGVNAVFMIKMAKAIHSKKEVKYYGFDLFELITEDVLEKEFSKSPPTIDFVRKRLKKTKVQFELYKGYTSETLPIFVKKVKDLKLSIDLVFVDGGHSIETISSDWNYVKKIMDQNTVVIFDDYYSNSEDEISGVGCNRVIDNLEMDKYSYEILEPQDRFEKDWGILKINMAKVFLKK